MKSMSKEESFEAINPKYKKAKKWSLKKLEKALDTESEGVSVTKSTIRKIEENIESKIQACSDLIGEQVDANNLAEFASRIQDKVVLIKLRQYEAEIQMYMTQLTQANVRLQDHVSSKEHVRDLIKRKNQ